MLRNISKLRPMRTDKGWRGYVVLMIARDAQYGNASTLRDIYDGRPERERARIRRAIKQLKELKDIIAVGPGLYELHYNEDDRSTPHPIDD